MTTNYKERDNAFTGKILIDWHDDEDRIRTGFGAENITRLCRLAVGILTSFQKPAHTIAERMRTRCFRTRLVFDDVWMTNHSVTGARVA